MRTNAIALAVLLPALGCGGQKVATGPGEVVATLPDDVLPTAMFGDDTVLHVMTGNLSADAGPQVFAFERVDVASGAVRDEVLPADLSWTDFDWRLFPDPVYQPIADGTEGEAFIQGLEGVTTVPFDGGSSQLLERPRVDANGNYTESASVSGFHVETDGSVTVVYCADHPVCGSLSPTGGWTELGETDDTCWPTQVLSDAAAIYFASRFSLWRIDRQSHEAQVLYYLPDSGETIGRLAQTTDSIVMLLPAFTDAALSGFQIAKVAKTGGPLVPLMNISPTSPADTGMVADDDYVYYLTRVELDRVSLATGSVEALAKRETSGSTDSGEYLFPVLGATHVYFIDYAFGSGGNAPSLVVRSVAK